MLTRGIMNKHLSHVQPLTDTPIVFFTVCTHQRRPYLAREQSHEILKEVWARSSEVNGWYVGDYVLMPDHLHFFARPSMNADPMRKWVQMWKSVSSRLIAKEQLVDGPVWQREYFDRYLRSSESYQEKWAYIEQNPVRAGLAGFVEEWPYRGRINRLQF